MTRKKLLIILLIFATILAAVGAIAYYQMKNANQHQDKKEEFTFGSLRSMEYDAANKQIIAHGSIKNNTGKKQSFIISVFVRDAKTGDFITSFANEIPLPAAKDETTFTLVHPWSTPLDPTSVDLEFSAVSVPSR